ncbi:reverse transcriptase domain-containing protein, partial [Tanacetum coccineum]
VPTEILLGCLQGLSPDSNGRRIEDKTAFFTGEGVFCYRKMPFGLKNARATYQRLVDKVFHDQIRRNLEAYIDDMVIKNKKNIQWTHEAEAVLQEMKKFVEILPTLMAPVQERF